MKISGSNAGFICPGIKNPAVGGPDLKEGTGSRLAVAAGIADFTHAGDLTFPAGGATPRDRGVFRGFRGAACREQSEGGDEEGEKGLLRRFHDGDGINGGGA